MFDRFKAPFQAVMIRRLVMHDGAKQPREVLIKVGVPYEADDGGFHYSDTWQLVINAGTTIVTFVIVFLIQRAQNKESLAVQLKRNEIVVARCASQITPT